MGLFTEIYEVVKRIPCGKVATYGQIADALCLKDVRRVGHALHQNPDNSTIPCHRVVNKDGCLSGGYAFGGVEVQAALLSAEGVTVVGNTVDLTEYGCVLT